MDIPDKQHQEIASVAKNRYRQHHIIVMMLGFFLGITVCALYFTHNNRAQQQSVNEQIPLSVASKTNPAPMQKVAQNWKTIHIQKGDTLSQIFRKQHLDQKQLIGVLAMPNTNKVFSHLKPGKEIKLLVDKKHQLQQLIYRPDLTTVIHVARNSDSFTVNSEKIPVENQEAYSHGEIHASLFNAGLRANLPCKLIMQMVDIFQWDIDFASDIRPGDSFDVIYEEKYINGEPVAKGNILSAQFINRGKKYTAIRYTDPTGQSGYYTTTGRSVKRQFTRSPVKFTRISSYFKPKRWHPVLHRFRKHEGVDYAAPAGTPIKATGDGRIAFIGRKGGYGNAVIIDHGNKVTTLYGHMLRFARHMHKNTKVKQGQVIGYVGMSGLATGYHCHYELRIKNKHHDPLKVKLPEGRSVPNKYKSSFVAQRNRLLQRMETYHTTVLASNNS